ncbi:targeting protein for Xklp2-like isoform X1 [Apis cerana]|uniref:targeting protein for Xklp2-like isoform X1 n=1 Tax=Apis cerana TaxID=7461 RepID=UPI0007E2DC56|nr:targeting protein for Xklp2-like isoform X1 [Apis cerana]
MIFKLLLKIMHAPTKLMNIKYGQAITPVTYSKNTMKVPPRKLWQKENVKPECQNDNWHKNKNSKKDEKWDAIQSPQFVDFSNLPDIGDSFFNRVTVVVSTPNPNLANEKLPSTITEDDSLITSLKNFSLSETQNETVYENPLYVNQKEKQKEEYVVHDVSINQVYENPLYVNQQEKEKEEYVVHNVSIKQESNIKTEICNKVQKSQNVKIYPFSFDLRSKNIQKQKEEQKQKQIKKILEEEKKIKIFHANPIPKFIKNRIKIEPIGNNKNEKNQKVNVPNKQIKKNTELWKKPPFTPCLSKKKLEPPKIGPLHSEIRAIERKRFDEIIKEKQKQKDLQKQMEIAAKKKQEEEEIAQLRKQIVHKAQPIRRYKIELPKVEKRPLTDPISPILLKRRRRV